MQVTREEVGALAVAIMELTDRMSRARNLAIDSTPLGVLRSAATRNGSLRPTEIADELGVHPSSVTRQVQALERAGKLVVKPDPGDGRASLIEITPAGFADLWKLYDQGVDAFHDAVADWPVTEVRALIDSIRHLLAALNARPERAAPPGGGNASDQ